MKKLNKYEIIKNSHYIFSIKSKDNKSVEVEYIMNNKTGKEFITDRISKSYKNIDELKEDICWNLYKDPDKFLILWSGNTAVAYACDFDE